MNFSLKHKLLFSSFSGLAFAILNSLTSYVFLDQTFSWSMFISNFLLFSFLFGFGYLFLVKKQTVKLMKKIQIDLKDGEVVQHEGPANLFRGLEGVGGKLLLTISDWFSNRTK